MIDDPSKNEAQEPEVPEEVSEDTQEPQASKSLSENVKSRPIWLRLFFMLVIGFIWGVSRFVIGAVIFLQFFWVLFGGETNNGLKRFGQQLAIFSMQVVSYLTFNTNERPFPFDLDWPEVDD
ncbi:MAG: DUF4389 domain-containing protein [Gammaproteobacteria bacterium]|nr:DUF4389 domain-containing protein [Gammaproteobacteria bacterium]MBT8150299.1 DUF4389 domain-containing protein [Gammaproteobacteria bacterium]NNM10822.1 DUF4389 domain-containing protein [Pseudomonadales bacterium]RZV50934.1 MAG: DUF4389 domain-containing protein [Pseudomonadales bacterium]